MFGKKQRLLEGFRVFNEIYGRSLTKLKRWKTKEQRKVVAVSVLLFFHKKPKANGIFLFSSDINIRPIKYPLITENVYADVAATEPNFSKNQTQRGTE